jgi:hypothetical protein
MGPVLGWPPLVWAMRVALLVLLAGCSYVYLLLIAPFFRPAHVLRMLKADIPRVRKFGAEIAGTRGEVEFERKEDALRARQHRSRRAVERKFKKRGGDDSSRRDGGA